MSVQTHLYSIARDAIPSEDEKASISRSITTLKNRLGYHFSTDDLSTHFQFGSSTRGTMLPRTMDAHSDVDYMIVFEDEDSKPQTYVSRLKRFAEKYYSSSEIAQSYPTVSLNLNHIKFDLVPAIKSYSKEYRIPGPSSGYQDWISTAPNAFNAKLSSANADYGHKLKPVIRLLKYWNSLAGYIYDSYGLEQWVADKYFYDCSTVRDYFFSCVESLSVSWDTAQWKKDKVSRAQQIVSKTKEYEDKDMPATAELEIKKLIP